MGRLTGKPAEIVQRLKGLEEYFGTLSGETLAYALKLYDRGANPEIVAFIFQWYKSPKKVMRAMSEHQDPDLAGKIDEILCEYFKRHLGGERNLVNHATSYQEEGQGEWGGLQGIEELVAEGRILARSITETSPTLKEAYAPDLPDTLLEEFERLNPERAGLAIILAGLGVEIQNVYDTLRFLPKGAFQLMFSTSYVAAHTGRNPNRVAEDFLKQYDPRQAAPTTNIILKQQKYN